MLAWLANALLTIVLWGAWGAISKIASDGIDANTNQIYFTVGLLPLVLMMLGSSRLREGRSAAPEPPGRSSRGCWAALEILRFLGRLAWVEGFDCCAFHGAVSAGHDHSCSGVSARAAQPVPDGGARARAACLSFC